MCLAKGTERVEGTHHSTHGVVARGSQSLAKTTIGTIAKGAASIVPSRTMATTDLVQCQMSARCRTNTASL